MSEIRRGCLSCERTGKVFGMGMIKEPCKACNGAGYIAEKVDEEPKANEVTLEPKKRSGRPKKHKE